MSIIDMIKEHNSKQQYSLDQDQAVGMFMQQKADIMAIQNKPWFKEIRAYWERVVIACNERLRTVKSQDIKSVQWELNSAMDFLSFLDNILSDDLEKEDLDILK